MATMMKCGHAANASRMVDGEPQPVCVICFGINPEAATVAEEPPSLEGRMSRCLDCGRTTPSNSNLPFFRHQPEEAEDTHYDGCRGWD